MMPPKMAMVSDDDFRKFHGVVEAFYEYQDRLLGEILAKADPKSLVILLSDHGFKNGPGRPTDDPPFIEGKPGKWHRLYGIFLVSGPGVKPGQIDTVSLLDVAPTVLALSGLPPAKEMSGRVLAEAFEPRVAQELGEEKAASYEAIEWKNEGQLAESSAADQEMIQNLRALGYIGGGAEGAPAEGAPSAPGELTGDTITYHANLAWLHLRSKQYDKAQTELDAALKLAPDYAPVLQTQALLYVETKRPEKALEVYRKIVDGGNVEMTILSSLANLYETTGKVDDGIAYFSGLQSRRPPSAGVPLGLAKLTEAKGDLTRAEAFYRQAIAADPGASEPAARLYEILKKRGAEASLEPEIARALELNENSVGHHNLMGLIQESKGNLPAAEKHLRRAVELDPDYAGVLANLGSLCARTGRSEEAIRILTRAVAKEPNNYEARMNLGAALGKSGRHQEAIAQFEEARRRGFKSPVLFNGLAIAYHETGQLQKCIDSLRQSLALDPNQPEVRALLADVESSKS
jgi:tetratricopeptide (TPR) repeat protein